MDAYAVATRTGLAARWIRRLAADPKIPTRALNEGSRSKNMYDLILK